MGAGSGSRTPAWGVATTRSKLSPLYNLVMRTELRSYIAPAWAANGGGRSKCTDLPSTERELTLLSAPAWKSDALAGSRTPAHGLEGGRTVNPYTDGSRTAYGGSGGVSFPMSK